MRFKRLRSSVVKSALAVCMIFAAGQAMAGESAVGEWNVEYSFGQGSTKAKLSIEEAEDGSLKGKWTSERGEGPVTDVKFEDGQLTFVREVTFRNNAFKMNFKGTIEGDTLNGAFSTGRGDIEVAGAREAIEEPAPARAERRARDQKPKIKPTFANVAYDDHENNVIDFYQAESTGPAPIAIYIHGGGFRGGSKNGINQGTLSGLLESGISVASVEYRVISHKPLPAAHRDARRALQFIRSKAGEWNLDTARMGAFGGSAGAQLCMWLAFHDEMADPVSDDPIERESSRLLCVATSGGQVTMDFDWWMENIPGYDEPHRDRTESYGEISDEAHAKIIRDISALDIISADDPPIFMSYGMNPADPVPDDESKAGGWKVHHVMFGVKLKERMDELGIEADLKHPGAETIYDSNVDFFRAKFGKSGTE